MAAAPISDQDGNGCRASRTVGVVEQRRRADRDVCGAQRLELVSRRGERRLGLPPPDRHRFFLALVMEIRPNHD
jgi:hypothetical protein